MFVRVFGCPLCTLVMVISIGHMGLVYEYPRHDDLVSNRTEFKQNKHLFEDVEGNFGRSHIQRFRRHRTCAISQ